MRQVGIERIAAHSPQAKRRIERIHGTHQGRLVKKMRPRGICTHPAPGLVHHSDRGVQYASHDYTALLEAHGIRISTSRRGNPYDNAMAESFVKTRKYEEVYRNEYRDLSEAWAGIGRFLEQVYNQKRLHSALGYRPPAEFEGSLAPASKPRPTSWATEERVRKSAG